MANTRYQLYMTGTTLLSRLGLNQHHLIPVNMRMTAVNSSSVDIISTVILWISRSAPFNIEHLTHQIVYFTPSTDKLFLSKQACITLEMTSINLPTIGENHENMCTPMDTILATMTNTPSEQAQITCNCPQCQTPYPAPTSLPFPASEEKWDCLD